MDIDKLTASIKLHEGFRAFPYQDTTGHITIGWGRNLTGKGIADDEAQLMLGNDLQSAIREAETQPWWNAVKGNDARENAFVEIGYNLGFAALSNFHVALAAASNGDWPACGAALLDSLWHEQVGQRAETLTAMIVTGQFPN